VVTSGTIFTGITTVTLRAGITLVRTTAGGTLLVAFHTRFTILVVTSSTVFTLVAREAFRAGITLVSFTAGSTLCIASFTCHFGLFCLLVETSHASLTPTSYTNIAVVNRALCTGVRFIIKVVA